MLDWLLLRKIREMARSVDNRTLLWQARLDNRFEHLLEQVKEEQTAAFRADGRLDQESLTKEVLWEYFRTLKNLDPGIDVMEAAEELGFKQKSEFILSLLKSYLAQEDKKNQ